MATQRNGLRKRQRDRSQTLILTAGAGFIIALCLCAFNFDLNGNPQPRLEMCQSKCDERLQSAALESTVSATSLSPPVMSTFLGRGADQHSTNLHGDRVSHANLSSVQQQQALSGRPRRLPTLIKILTGFGDEPYWNDQRYSSSDSSSGHKPIIVRTESPHFVHQAHQQRRRGTDGSMEPLSHDETVQIAAAAADAALWSKSIRIFGHHRMQRVNSEWDAALRWVAGWDQNQQMPPSSASYGGTTSESTRTNDSESLHGGVPNDADREGYTSFVDELAEMLEMCISKCVEDEHFEFQDRQGNNKGPGEVAMGGLSVAGDLILRSILGRFIGPSFPNISFGKPDIISSEMRFIIARAFQLVASSVAMFALHSLWTWAFPLVFNWYSSSGYTESPEWLIQHEKEIEQTRSSLSRQRKKAKRRQLTKQSGNRNRHAPNNAGNQKKSHSTKGTSDGVCTEPTRSTGHDVSAQKPGLQSKLSSVATVQKQSALENAVLSSRDSVSVSQSSCTTEGIPRLISCPSASVSSSPSMKPIGSHLEDPYIAPLPLLEESYPPLPGLHSQSVPQNPMFPHPSQQKALPVPTQEQRNEAAKQLREFQNAQIQRLLFMRKLSQNPKVSSLPATMPPQRSRLLHGACLQSAGHSFMRSSGQRNQTLKPPPGFTHPSEQSENHDLNNKEDTGFLTDNELLLSRLLDDDDDDVIESSSPSPEIGIGSLSYEPSSLDPSAAPFVSEKQTPLFPKSKDEKIDAWQSSPGEISLNASSPARIIKGVYGGSVW